MIRFTWVLIVSGATPSSRAISLFEWPHAMKLTMDRSRSVSVCARPFIASRLSSSRCGVSKPVMKLSAGLSPSKIPEPFADERSCPISSFRSRTNATKFSLAAISSKSFSRLKQSEEKPARNLANARSSPTRSPSSQFCDEDRASKASCSRATASSVCPVASAISHFAIVL